MSRFRFDRIINRQTRRDVAGLKVEASDKDLIFDRLIAFRFKQCSEFLQYLSDRYLRQRTDIHSIADSPVQTLHLIRQDDTCHRQTLGNGNLKPFIYP